MITASATERGLVSETEYMVIDSDSHVVETERTWQFMDPGDEKHRPVLAAHPTDPHTHNGGSSTARLADCDFPR